MILGIPSSILTMKYPVEKGGIVNNWDDYEKVLHNTFYNQLRVAPEENAVAVLIPPHAPTAQKEKLMQVWFFPPFSPFSSSSSSSS